MMERLAEDGYRKSDVLHVAQSLFHDHAPANAIGLASAWIDRRHGTEGWGATAPPPAGVRYDFRFESLAELAETVARS
jgi:FMN phosphatase YigB (HAD superfamily)